MKRSLLFLFIINFYIAIFSQENGAGIIANKITGYIQQNQIEFAESYYNQNKHQLDSLSQELFYTIISIKKFSYEKPIDIDKTVNSIINVTNDFFINRDQVREYSIGILPYFSTYISFLCHLDNTALDDVYRIFKDIWPSIEGIDPQIYIRIVEDVSVFQINHNSYENAIASFTELLQLEQQGYKTSHHPYLYKFLQGRCYLSLGKDQDAQALFDDAINSIPRIEKEKNSQIYYNLCRERFELAIKHNQLGVAKLIGNELLDYYKIEQASQDYINVSIELSRLLLSSFNIKEGISLYESGIELILASSNYDKSAKHAFVEDLYTLYNTYDISNENQKFKEYLKELNVDAYKKEQGTQLLTQSYIDSLEVIIKENSTKIIDATKYVHAVSYVSLYYSNREKELYGIELINTAVENCIKNSLHELDYAILYNSLGNIYSNNLHNYKMAIDNQLKSKDIYSKYDLVNSDYINLLCDLANDYRLIGDLLNSSLYIDEAYRISLNINSIKSDKTTYYNLLHRLSQIYASQGEEKQALCFNSMILEDIESCETQELNIKYIFLLYRLQLLLEFNDFKEAENLLGSIDKNSSEDYNIWWTSYETKFFNNDSSCLLDLQRLVDITKQNIIRLFSNISPDELNYYWDVTAGNLNLAHGMLLSKFSNPQACVSTYNNLLFTKTFQYGLSRVRKKDLVNTTENLSNICNKVISETKTTQEVFETLDKNDIAIEFFQIYKRETYNSLKKKYAALVLDSYNKTPSIVELCDCDSIEKIVYSNLPDNSLEYANKYYDISNYDIYRLLWKPLECVLPANSNIYISGMGATLSINFAALSNGEKRLCDYYNIHNVLSTALIQSCKDQNRTYNTALLYGGIDYNTSFDDMINESKKYAVKNLSSETALYRGIEERGSWGTLPYTIEETDHIESTLLQQNCAVTKYTMSSASEESVKALNGFSPDIIHFSTHGFYYQPFAHSFNSGYTNSFFADTNNGSSLYSSPMKYNGLLLSGANNAWKDNKYIDGVEDGVLTAEEIAVLDLSKTKLVALSACQTGLGETSDIDGNQGLIKAFKNAGVKDVITALWSVNDAATALLMETFYKYLLSGMTAFDALQCSQRDLWEMNYSPYYWAAFVLSE